MFNLPLPLPLPLPYPTLPNYPTLPFGHLRVRDGRRGGGSGRSQGGEREEREREERERERERETRGCEPFTLDAPIQSTCPNSRRQGGGA